MRKIKWCTLTCRISNINITSWKRSTKLWASLSTQLSWKLSTNGFRILGSWLTMLNICLISFLNQTPIWFMIGSTRESRRRIRNFRKWPRKNLTSFLTNPKTFLFLISPPTTKCRTQPAPLPTSVREILQPSWWWMNLSLPTTKIWSEISRRWVISKKYQFFRVYPGE